MFQWGEVEVQDREREREKENGGLLKLGPVPEMPVVLPE